MIVCPEALKLSPFFSHYMILFSFQHKSNPPSSVLSFLVPSAHAPFLYLVCLMFLLSLVLSSLHSDPSKDTTSFPPSLPPSQQSLLLSVVLTLHLDLLPSSQRVSSSCSLSLRHCGRGKDAVLQAPGSAGAPCALQR